MKRHNHSPEQQQLLSMMLQDVGQKLLSIDFDKPEDDNKMIRAHAFAKGQFSILNQLLSDEYPAPEQAHVEGEE